MTPEFLLQLHIMNSLASIQGQLFVIVSIVPGAVIGYFMARARTTR